MGDFQKNVFIIALVILSFSLIFIAAVISEKETGKKFPAEISTCPPYYSVVKDDDDQSLHCELNDKFSAPGISKCKKFSLRKDGKLQSDKAKCEWAKDCKITWDGVWKRGTCNGKSDNQGIIEPTADLV